MNVILQSSQDQINAEADHAEELSSLIGRDVIVTVSMQGDFHGSLINVVFHNDDGWTGTVDTATGSFTVPVECITYNHDNDTVVHPLLVA
jgi:hypothetical protein